jgi:5-(carboxyamino)imidazole ribonucleotide synthase
VSLPPGSTIGIVGGGQLGRMSAMAAARLGYRAHILTEDKGGPAAQVAAGLTLGAYDDAEALRRFADAVDVITFEFENVSAEGLALLAELKPVRPSPTILGISQDRIREKSFLNNAGVATAPWAEVTDAASLSDAIARIGLPAILKTSRLGYDGRGQARVSSPEEAEAAFARLAPKPLILEGFVDFACEVSVVVARGVDGAIASFDTVENQHRNGILDVTFAPARISEAAAEGAQALGRTVAEALDLVGLLAIEMFVDRDGLLRVNEIAPRPHNSGHWTIDACGASQFEMHIRAVAGLPLPEPRRHSDAVMKNLIGPDDMALWPAILRTPGLIPHHYGKTEARPGRKMGHVNRLFPKGGLPGPFGVNAALGPLAETHAETTGTEQG